MEDLNFTKSENKDEMKNQPCKDKHTEGSLESTPTEEFKDAESNSQEISTNAISPSTKLSDFYTLGTSSSVLDIEEDEDNTENYHSARVNTSSLRSDKKLSLNDEDSNDSSNSVTLGHNDKLDSTLSLESLDLEVPSSYKVELVDFPSNPGVMKQSAGFTLPVEVSSHSYMSDDDEDRSIYQAQLLSNCQDVRLTRERPNHLNVNPRRRVISVSQDILYGNETDDDQKTESSIDGSHLSPDDPDLDLLLDSPDELEDSILERLDRENVEAIPELTPQEERAELRAWKSCMVGGIERRIDLKVLEPYKRVVSHGGYLSQGSHNAIIVFSACFLPDRSRVDYDYVMNNLFMYVLTTLDQLITDDYVLIYLHGATSRSCMPKFSWLKQCYHMIDRKLRKNLKGLYLVHPTFWLKTLVLMTKPFISAKFSKKLFFIYSLSELFRKIPLEQASIPERVKKYDALKQSLDKG